MLYELLAVVCGLRVQVRGPSMYPLLKPGERVLFDRLAYALRPPRRGEVVLVAPPRGPGERLVKLLVGLPGEQVAVAEDALSVNGRPLSLPEPLVGSLPGHWRLGPDEYFVLSSAVEIGTDSRHFGPVPRRALLGCARLVYWPPAGRRPIVPFPIEPDDPVADAGPWSGRRPGRADR